MIFVPKKCSLKESLHFESVSNFVAKKEVREIILFD